jgi:hypothetical protein
MSAARRGAKRKSIWRPLALAAGAGVILIAGFQLYTRVLMKPDAVGDIFSLIERQGYTPSVGFSGTFEPGNIIQVAERKAGGAEGPLEPPLVFLWSGDCFPGVEARDTTFVLPESSGTSSAALTAGAPAISRVAPALSLSENAVVDYRLAFDNVRVRTLARGEISGKLADKCVAALNQEMATGDKVGWYRVIVEAVVADGISFEMNWKADTKAQARKDAIGKAMGSIAKAAAGESRGPGAPALDLRIVQDDTHKTVLSARRLVVVGYRARPMQPKVADQ